MIGVGVGSSIISRLYRGKDQQEIRNKTGRRQRKSRGKKKGYQSRSKIGNFRYYDRNIGYISYSGHTNTGS